MLNSFNLRFLRDYILFFGVKMFPHEIIMEDEFFPILY